MFEQETAALEQKIEDIKKRYEPRIAALKQKGEQLEDDFERPSDVGVVIGVDFKVDWKDVELIFDLPSLTVKDKKISLDLPEIFSNQQRIVFDVPDVRMVDRVIGKKPEVHWPKVIWTDIIISIPEPYMRRVEIIYDIPSVRMKRNDFVLGIPEVSMTRHRWVVGLPQFTVVNVSAKTEEIQKKGQGLKTEGEQLGSEMRAEIESEVEKFKAGFMSSALSTKVEISNAFNNALGSIRTAIEDLQSKGCDPIKVPTDQGDVNLRKTYDELDVAKSRAVGDIEHALGTSS